MLDEIFEFKRKLGSGWSADTWIAKSLQPRYGMPEGTEFAIKLYKNSIFEDADNIIDRVRREGHLGSSLTHPNIVKIHELIEAEDRWALVMELCDNENLSEFIKGNWPLDGSLAMELVSGIGQGILMMHEREVVHRDIKPQNILLSDGLAKIGDFGVVSNIEEATVTGSSEFLGTIRYAAPEALSGEVIGKHSDVYSFGAILFELLYGREPFEDYRLFSRLIVAITSEDHVFPSEMDRFGREPKLTDFLIESVCMAALKMDALERPNIEEAVRNLQVGPDSKIVRRRLASMIYKFLQENDSLIKEKRNTKATLFKRFKSLHIALQMTEDHCLKTFQNKTEDFFFENEEYMEMATAYPPDSENYLQMPLLLRFEFCNELEEMSFPYIHAVWDEIEWIYPRAVGIQKIASRLEEVETDEMALEAIRKAKGIADAAIEGIRNPNPFH